MIFPFLLRRVNYDETCEYDHLESEKKGEEEKKNETDEKYVRCKRADEHKL